MTLSSKRKIVATIAIVVCVSLIACGWFSNLDLWQKIVNDICCTALGVAFLLVGFPERVDAVLSRFRKSEPVEVEDDYDTEADEEDDSEIETDTEDEENADYSDSCEGDDCDVTCDCETTEDKE